MKSDGLIRLLGALAYSGQLAVLANRLGRLPTVGMRGVWVVAIATRSLEPIVQYIG
jgi:hypothetical protein